MIKASFIGLQFIHYTAIICTAMLFGGAIASRLWCGAIWIGMALGIALAVATAWAIKEQRQDMELEEGDYWEE